MGMDYKDEKVANLPELNIIMFYGSLFQIINTVF